MSKNPLKWAGVISLDGVPCRVLSVGEVFVRCQIVAPRQTRKRFVGGMFVEFSDGQKRRVLHSFRNGTVGVIER